jgi:hypothetical protein
VQTFLPYPDFAASAAVLDDRRLGKQRVEALQVLRALVRPVYGWKHHPAVRMWAGHTESLTAYGLVVCEEWIRRGKSDTVVGKLLEDAAAAGVRTGRSQAQLTDAGAVPPWLGDQALHLSHRAALVRKDPERYRPVFGDVDPDLPYVWPVQKDAPG